MGDPGSRAAATLGEHADRLRTLHSGPHPLLLANVWDVASARLVAESGAAAVATSSGAVAAALGYEDGERMPVEVVFSALSRISASVVLPVTADLEAGYGLSADELVERVCAAGAVGLNLEDSDPRQGGVLQDPEVQAGRIAAVKAAGRRRGVDLVLNARVDVFLREHGPAEARLGEALRRGRLYRDAGADCIYPIGTREEATIAALLEGIQAPLNVLYRPGSPSIGRLAQLGVARISLASGLMRTAYAAARRQVAELIAEAGGR